MNRVWFGRLSIFITVVLMLIAGCAPVQPEQWPEEVAEAGRLSGIEVVSERAIGDIVGTAFPWLATLSPDGQRLAWLEPVNIRVPGQICLFAFFNADRQCYELPDEFRATPYQLVWSPDSAYLAFTENPIQFRNESDIWVLHTADGTYTNRTDDGIAGAYFNQEPGSFALDYVPTFSETDGNIYFLRAVTTDPFQYTLDIYRVSPDTGDPEFVRNISDALPGHRVLFDKENLFLDGMTDISPDGRAMALLLSETGMGLGTVARGLFTVDLVDPALPPQMLMSLEDYQSAQPQFANAIAMPSGLSWTSDGTAVVSVGVSRDRQFPARLFYYTDAASGESVPIVDFSPFENRDDLFATSPDSGLPFRYYSPWSGALSPVGDKLLMFNDLGNVTGLLTVPLPPNGELPIPTHRSAIRGLTNDPTASSANTGKSALSGILFTIEEQ